MRIVARWGRDTLQYCERCALKANIDSRGAFCVQSGEVEMMIGKQKAMMTWI